MLNGYNQKKSNRDKKRIPMHDTSSLIIYVCQIFFFIIHSDNENDNEKRKAKQNISFYSWCLYLSFSFDPLHQNF